MLIGANDYVSRGRLKRMIIIQLDVQEKINVSDCSAQNTVNICFIES